MCSVQSWLVLPDWTFSLLLACKWNFHHEAKLKMKEKMFCFLCIIFSYACLWRTTRFIIKDAVIGVNKTKFIHAQVHVIGVCNDWCGCVCVQETGVYLTPDTKNRGLRIFGVVGGLVILYSWMCVTWFRCWVFLCVSLVVFPSNSASPCRWQVHWIQFYHVSLNKNTERWGKKKGGGSIGLENKCILIKQK